MQTAKKSHTPVRGPGLLAKPPPPRQGARLQEEGGEEKILPPPPTRIDEKEILRQILHLPVSAGSQHWSVKEV